MSDHLYTVTVDAIQDPVEFTYEAAELDLPLNASAEQAVSHVTAKILEDPSEFISIPYKLLVTVVREDEDSCHTSMIIEWQEGDDE